MRKLFALAAASGLLLAGCSSTVAGSAPKSPAAPSSNPNAPKSISPSDLAAASSAAAVASAQASDTPAPPEETGGFDTEPDVLTFRVTGNGTHAMVTYGMDTDIEQNTNAPLPWSKKVTPGSFSNQVSAQDKDGTSITCEIVGADGSVLVKHTSTGSYAVVMCSTG